MTFEIKFVLPFALALAMLNFLRKCGLLVHNTGFSCLAKPQ